MHALLLQAWTQEQTANQGLNHTDFRRLGSLAFAQLKELRHKGAFSTVAQTFALCCIKCAQSHDAETRKLPELWYHVSVP